MTPVVLAAACLLMVATATAQDRVAPAEKSAAAADTTDGSGVRSGTDVVVNAWNWYLPLYVYNDNLGTSTRYSIYIPRNSSDNFWIAATDPRGEMLVESAASNHYLAILWNSSSTWIDSLLYYY